VISYQFFGRHYQAGVPDNTDPLVVRGVFKRTAFIVTIRTGRLTVYPDIRIAMVDDNPLRLTAKEYEVLELLSLRKGTAVTKEMFFNHLYDGKNEPRLKIIDVFICKLRKKLSRATGGERYIETAWGRGYRLRDPFESRAASSSLVSAQR
jgi:two-component system cell cycle response regulator CtrA